MNFLQNVRKRPEWVAFVSALTVGLLVHMFALVAVLHNFDDISNQPGGYGAAIETGRWLLEILGRVMSKLGLSYNLPVINGVIGIAFFAVTAGFVVSTLQISNKFFSLLIGSLLICFPTVAATLFYRFTVTYYSLAMLLAVVSVWVLRKYRMGLILSALALCCSMGIYQAYAPVAIGLFVLTLIRKAFQDGADVKELVMDGLYDCLALILGVGMYMIALKLSLRVANIQLIAYQGADTIGKLVLLDVPKLIGEAYRSFFTIAFQDYCGISGRKLIQMQYLVLGVLSVSTMIYLWAVKVKKRINILASMVLCVLFPLAVNFIVLMCPDGWIYTMMVYSFALVGCLPIVLVDCMPSDRKRSNRVKKIAEKLVGIVVAFLVFCYGYSDNVNYSALYYANRQVENYVASIITQTRMAEGFTPEKKWAFLGEIEDPLLKSQWDEEGYYGGNSYAHHLLINYSRNDWFENYIGYTLPLASDQTIADLSQMDEVKSMPCWPSQGAIKVVGDTVVIKFQNIP